MEAFAKRGFQHLPKQPVPEKATHVVVGMIRLEKEKIEQENLGQNQPHHFMFSEKMNDLGKVREMVRQEKKEEEKKQEEYVAAGDRELMVRSVPEDKSPVPNHERGGQGHREKIKGELRDPLFRVLPPFLGRARLEVTRESDEKDPDDVVLADQKTQDARDTGKPETPVQG